MPARIGLMILPGVTLFPHALLPLYIFVERYRQMLRAAIDGTRMFAIAHGGEEGIAAIGGLGIIRACVANDDGTSNLILQGVSRAVLDDLKMEPFPSAAVAPLMELNGGSSALARLREEISGAFRRIREAGIEAPGGFDKFLAQIKTHADFADAIAAAFVSDPLERRELLEECDVEARMRHLLRILLREIAILTGHPSAPTD